MFDTIPDPPNVLYWTGLLTAAVGAAAAAGYVALPFAQTKLYPPTPYTRLRDHILFERVLEDGRTVRCTDGTLLQVVGLAGVDLSARAPDVQENLYQRRRQWIDALAETPVVPRVVSTRTRYDHASNVDDFQNLTLREIQRIWHSGFRRSYRNRHSIVLSVPPGDRRDFEALVDAVRMTEDKLRDYGPHVLELGHPRDPSPLLSYLAEFLNPGREMRVGADVGVAQPRRTPAGTSGIDGALDARLADHLITMEVLFNGDWSAFEEDGIAVFRDGPHQTWMAALGVGSWGAVSATDIVAQVLSVDAELVVSQHMKVWDAAKAQVYLGERMKRSVKGQAERLQGVSGRTMNEFSAALELVSARGADQQRIVEHQFEVFVFGADRADLEYRVGLVKRAFEMFQANAVRETASCEPLWFSLFPPHQEWVRPIKLMSGNVAGFVSFETPTQGFTRCDWGDRPVQVFPTALGSPYSFIWHKEDRPGGGSPPTGHTMIIGGTGSGKTVMLDFLGLSTLGYPDTYVFKTDRFAGSYIATKAAGGAYLELQSDDAMAGEPCQLNPLHIELSADPGHGPTGWVVNWLRDHVTGCDDIESERALGDAVRALAGLGKDKRNLTEIYRALPDNIPAKRELKRWVEGQYSYLFGGVDTLSLRDRRLVTFAFDRVLQDPIACRALLPYLSYRIEAAMEAIGAPFLFQIDETAAMLEDAGFRKWFVRLHDEVRKKRGVIVSCFQRVQSLAQAGVADTMLTSCPTQILLPNESATADDYCGVLGCTMVELAIVRGEHPTARMLGKRYALLRREGQGSVVLNTDLSVLGPHLNLFASGRSIASRFRQFEDSEGVTERAVAAYLASFGGAGRTPTAAAA